MWLPGHQYDCLNREYIKKVGEASCNIINPVIKTPVDRSMRKVCNPISIKYVYSNQW